MRESERERKREDEWIGIGSTEIDINKEAEPRYRTWLKERTTRTTRPLYFQEAVYGGAESTGISPITSRRYLAKATSPQGDFLLVRHTVQGRSVNEIVYKNPRLDLTSMAKTGKLLDKLDTLDKS